MFDLQQKLAAIIKYFNLGHLKPIIGCELEFYLPRKFELYEIGELIESSKFPATCSKESGENQFEIQFLPSHKFIDYALYIEKIKARLSSKLNANFQAKPDEQKPGSSLHIHINFIDDQKNNLFNSDRIIGQAAAGILHLMPAMMVFYAPTPECYIRYAHGSLQSPSKICWGNNNRSTALRIPPDPMVKRLENRVPSSNCNVEHAILATIFSSLIGIAKEMQPPEKIHGNAFLDIYQAPPIAKNFIEAKETYEKSLPFDHSKYF